MTGSGRDLMRRPSWSSVDEWTRDMFGPEPIRTNNAAAAPPPLSEDVVVVQASFSLLQSLGLGPTLQETLLASPHLANVLRFGLLQAKDEALRKAVARGLHRLCVEGRRSRRKQLGGAVESGTERDLVQGLLKAMISLLPELSEAGEEEGCGCEEFFALLTRLISAPDALAAVDPLDLARTLARQIIQRRVVEASETEQDLALRGFMAALRALLAFMPDSAIPPRVIKFAVGSQRGEGLLNELFHRCLFAVPSTDVTAKALEGVPPPKCKHPESRELGLGLVLELSRGCPENFGEVVGAVEAHHTLGISSDEKERRRSKAARKRKSSQWSRRRGGSNTTASTVLTTSGPNAVAYATSKSRSGYVGLKNMGCICYMNSTMQQFFMVKGFREGILTYEDTEEDKDESLMYQLQSLFAHLQETHKAYYNPKVSQYPEERRQSFARLSSDRAHRFTTPPSPPHQLFMCCLCLCSGHFVGH